MIYFNAFLIGAGLCVALLFVIALPAGIVGAVKGPTRKPTYFDEQTGGTL